jgi:hypothetical protein
MVTLAVPLLRCFDFCMPHVPRLVNLPNIMRWSYGISFEETLNFSQESENIMKMLCTLSSVTTYGAWLDDSIKSVPTQT